MAVKPAKMARRVHPFALFFAAAFLLISSGQATVSCNVTQHLGCFQDLPKVSVAVVVGAQTRERWPQAFVV